MRCPLLSLATGGVLAFGGWCAGRYFANNQVRPADPGSESERMQKARDRVVEESQANDPARFAASSFDEQGWRKAGAELAQENYPGRREHRLFEMASRLATADFAAAMQALVGVDVPRGELLEIFAERDLPAARTWFDGRPLEERAGLVRNLSRTWARVDSDALLRWLGEQGGEEREAFGGVLQDEETVRSLAENNPTATLALFDRYATVKGTRNEFGGRRTHVVFEAWAERDGLSAARRAVTLPTGEEKSSAISFTIHSWTNRDPAAVRAWIEQLVHDGESASAWNAYETALSVRDPLAAMDFLLQKPTAARKPWELSAVAQIAAEKDPESMLAFAHQQTDPGTRTKIVDGVIAALRLRDGKRAAEVWLQESASSGSTPGGAGQIAESLAREHGIAEALRFLGRIPQEFAAAAKESPVRIAASRGCRAVVEAALGMPAGARREAWLTQTLEQMVKDGEVSTAQQLATRTAAGAERDAATRVIGATLLRDDPDAGAQVLLGLVGGVAHLERETRNWLGKDPEGAKRWIDRTSMLTADDKKRLLDKAKAP